MKNLRFVATYQRLKATVSVVGDEQAGLGVSIHKFKAVVNAITSIGVAKVQSAAYNLALELGTFVLLFRKQDTVAISSEALYELQKALADTATAAEDYTELFLKKAKSLTASADDMKRIFAFYKTCVDTSVTLDLHHYEFSKELRDQMSVIDDAINAFEKTLADALLVEDHINTIGFAKTLAHVSLAVDDQSWSFTGRHQDTFIASDDELRSTSKQLFDLVTATDDVDGMASIEDDQEVQFFKLVHHSASAADAFQRLVQFIRAFDDAASTTDHAILLTELAKTDSFSSADAYSASFSLPKQDGFSASERRVMALARPLAEWASVTDSRYSYVAKPFYETTAAQDAHYKSVALTKRDSLSLVDTDKFAFSKPAADAASFTDVIELLRYFQRDNYDTTSITDTGSLRSQGYSDFSYFAEDFVGASRTF